MKKNKIFVACDTTKVENVRKIINNTKTNKLNIGYKFGLEFINSKYGRKFISNLKKKIIFLDLKLHDIPNTCLSTIKSVRDLNANYITIHISSGIDALKSVKKVSGKTKIVGVTTLTSLNEKNLREIGHNKKINALVFHQAKLASKAKLDAIVCGAKEVKIVKKVFKKEIITPGIRLDNKFNDQKRIMTPKNAFKNGSDALVIGRPLTKGNIKRNLEKLIDHLKND